MTRDTPPVGPSEPTDLIRSVSRALRILEEVARADRSMSAKMLARRCELNLSTTYHLVRTLSYEGYVVRQPGGVYVVGPEVVGRFYELVESLHRPPRVRVVLRQLAEATGHTAYLARFDAGRVVVADLVEGPRSPYVEDLQVGLETAAHATALGKALLATLPRPQRRRWLTEFGMRAFTVNTPTDPEQMDGELRGIGFGDIVVEHGQFRDNVSCAGAALPGDEDGCWAIGVSSRAEDVPAPVLASLRDVINDLAALRKDQRAGP